jgi:hypothetical protein
MVSLTLTSVLHQFFFSYIIAHSIKYLIPWPNSGNNDVSHLVILLQSLVCIYLGLVRFQGLTVVSMKMTAFWNITLCSLAEVDRRSRGAHFLPWSISVIRVTQLVLYNCAIAICWVQWLLYKYMLRIKPLSSSPLHFHRAYLIRKDAYTCSCLAFC